MKLLDLPQEMQNGLLVAFSRFTYPLYCTTGVENYDYFFIGTCFPLRVNKKIFFIYTEHQLKLAGDKDIVIAFPESTDKFIGIKCEKVARFPEIDIAMFEFNEKPLMDELHALDLSLIKPPSKDKEMEYAVLGCHRASNAINYNTKEIEVKKGALITDKADIKCEDPKFYFSNTYLTAGSLENISNLKSITDQTQGLSGSPVIAFTVNEINDINGDIDLHLVGVATHVAEKDKMLYATHPMHLVSILQEALNIFPNHEELHKDN